MHRFYYLRAVLAELSILSGRTPSTHSLGLARIFSHRATSGGVESIQSTSVP